MILYYVRIILILKRSIIFKYVSYVLIGIKTSYIVLITYIDGAYKYFFSILNHIFCFGIKREAKLR